MPASDVIFVNVLFINKIFFKNVIDSTLEKGAVVSLLGYEGKLRRCLGESQ